MKIITIYIATSLDGFIADKNGSVDWLNEFPESEESNYFFNEFMESIDTIIMGRNTFETVQSFGVWPYSKPVVVLSRTLAKIPETYRGKATISNEKIPKLLERLQKEGFDSFYIDGGKVIQDFLSLDLVDQMIITRVPILLGNGIPLFGKLNRKIHFDHVRTRDFNNGFVMNTYCRKRV